MSKLLRQLRLDTIIQKFQERNRSNTPSSAELRKIVAPNSLTQSTNSNSNRPARVRGGAGGLVRSR